MSKNELNFVVLGDFHIGAHLPKALPTKVIRDLHLNIAMQIEKYAKKHKINYGIQLGDLFDSAHPSNADFCTLYKWLLTDNQHEIHWIINRGNHEYEDVNNNAFMLPAMLQSLLLEDGSRLCRHRFITQPTEIVLKGHRLVFLPWPYRRGKILQGEPGVVFAHVLRAGTMDDNGYTIPVDKDTDFPLGKHLWIVGDNHKFQWKGKNWIHPGLPFQKHYHEAIDRYFLHVTLSPTGKPTIKKIKLKLPYKLQQIIVQTEADLKLLKAASKEKKTWTRAKVVADLFIKARKYEKAGRIEVVPLNKSKSKDENNETNIMVVRSRTVRRTLLKRRLQSEGFSKKNVKRGLRFADKAEREVSFQHRE